MLHEMIDSASYMAHGYCLLWKPWLVALHAGSDLLIFAAYFAIPVAIWIFVSQRPNIEMRGLARLFAAFILWCGFTHVINVVTLWWPIYEFQGLVKAITAGISLATAVVIFPLIPRALAIPSPRELQLANQELAREVAAHRSTLAELEQARAALEQRVEARTQELREMTEQFRSLFKHAPVAMLMADSDGRILRVNGAAEALFHYEPDEMVGCSVEMLLPEARRDQHVQLRAAYHCTPTARPMGVGRELFGRRKDGEEVPVEIGLSPMFEGEKTSVVASIVDISSHRRAEQRMQLIMRELTHRSKNLLAVIQALAREAAGSSPDVESFHRNFGERLHGLAQSHDLLVERNWEGAPIDDLVRSQLAFLGQTDRDRIEIEGDTMMLAPEAAQNLGLALHELVTNAVKHGALSQPAGRVEIAWSTTENEKGERRLHFSWRERSAADVRPPTRRGFGHTVLEDIVPAMLGGTASLNFAPEGTTWTLDVACRAVLSAMRHAAGNAGART